MAASGTDPVKTYICCFLWAASLTAEHCGKWFVLKEPFYLLCTRSTSHCLTYPSTPTPADLIHQGHYKEGSLSCPRTLWHISGGTRNRTTSPMIWRRLHLFLMHFGLIRETVVRQLHMYDGSAPQKMWLKLQPGHIFKHCIFKNKNVSKAQFIQLVQLKVPATTESNNKRADKR